MLFFLRLLFILILDTDKAIVSNSVFINELKLEIVLQIKVLIILVFSNNTHSENKDKKLYIY